MSDHKELIAEAGEAEDWPRFPARRTAELIHRLRAALEATQRELHMRELHHFETEVENSELRAAQPRQIDRGRVLAILADRDYNDGGGMRWYPSLEPTEQAHKVADRIVAESLSPIPATAPETINDLTIEDWFKIAQAKDEFGDACVAAIDDLTDAIRLTVEYVGNDTLPALEGWSWFDALMRHRPEIAEEFERNPILLYANSAPTEVVPVPATGEVEWAARVDFKGVREPVFYEYPDSLSADRFIKNPPLWFDQSRPIVGKSIVSRTKAGPWEVTP